MTNSNFSLPEEQIVDFLSDHEDLLKNNDFDNLADCINEEEDYFDGGNGEDAGAVWQFIRETLNINILKYSKLHFIPAFAFFMAEGISSNGILTVPPNIRGIDVSGFSGCDLKEIIFQGNIDSIYDAAFTDCKNLEIIRFEGKNPLQTFMHDAFTGCDKLREIQVHSNTLSMWKVCLSNARKENLLPPNIKLTTI